jgi:surface antigen
MSYIKQKLRRSKRITSLTLLRQLFLIIGGFLILGGVFAPSTEARANILEPNQPVLAPIEANDNKLDTLKQTFEVKKGLVEEKQQIVEVAVKEANKIAETKETLAEQVADAKEEIAVLQAKLAEKKRLEALRIVNVGASVPGNTYAAGYCTWYVKSKRPDLPNRMGNANLWYGSAKANGYKTGTMAKTGAVGVSFNGPMGHVVYVEQWYPNGTIRISEMNFAGLYQITSRVVPESEFVYIYEKT